jgi:type VI secretion system secreted protein VgrG
VVIADGGAPLTTDRDHRVRIRFPWLRAPAVNAFSDPGSSDRTQVTAWVRVATASAGPNWGGNHLPRAGTQVLLTFLDGDIDRPMVAMQLHNTQDALPWAPADAPLGQALSGWHSQGLSGDGYNQWVVDDHPGQLRTRLASSSANSQLNLGYVTSHGATGGERGSWRGTGAELRTDAWAVVRAGAGLLLSTTARAQAAGTVLDAHEARGQLTAAQRTAQRLSDAASSQQALPLAATEAFEPITQALDPAQDGHYKGNVNGQDATQPSKAPVERFGQPLLVAESPSSIALTSQATTTVYAGRHLHGTAQADWHLATGNVVAAAAAKGVSLFAQRNGIRAVAEGGPVSIQAHTDALAVLADKAVTVTSSADSVEILAQQNIVLHGGDSMIRLEGNAITFETSGTLSVKGAGHPLIGPGGQAAALPALPTSTNQPNWIEMSLLGYEGQPMRNIEYELAFTDGTKRTGKLNGAAEQREEGVPWGGATLTYKNNPSAKDVVRPTLDDLLAATEPLIRGEEAKLNSDKADTVA